MTHSNILFVGMDIHKVSIEIAIAEGANPEVRRYGKIGGAQDALRKTLRILVSLGKTLHFFYEAGPCDYEFYRYLVSQGHDCWVVAPSQVPELDTSVFMIPGTAVKNGDDRLVVRNNIALSDDTRGKHDTHVFTFRKKPIDHMSNSGWRRAREKPGYHRPGLTI